ncbi:MAG: T9SS type A sorting domain-containing protein [Agriterribacter sp.]
MKPLLFFLLILLLVTDGNCQTMQATIKRGTTPRTIDIYLKPSASFSQKDEAMTFVVAIPSSVLPAPSMGSSGVTTNSTGPVTGITGLQPDFLTDNLGSTQREVFVSTESINSSSYYIYTFIFSGTASSNHDWTGGTEQQVFSIQFNGCTSNCDPTNEMLVNLPNGGANSNAYWYFQPNTIGDITNYAAPFYSNSDSGPANNGGSSDGSALSTISLTSSVTLPVKLESFNVHSHNCAVNTSWAVTSNSNALYYELEKSENGVDFKKVDVVNATAQEGLMANYSYTDETASGRRLYYRLKLEGKDGTFSYSDVESVLLNCAGAASVFIYPTLTEGQINIRLGQGYQKSEIRIINSLGQQLLSDESNNLFRTLNLKKFPDGTYLVQVIDKNQIVGNEKIVLNK